VAFLTLILLLAGGDLFVVDASAQATYNVSLSREQLRTYVDDIGLFARNMPGVVAVKPLTDSTYLYQTEKDIPLSGAMKTDFVIHKTVVGDSVTTYLSRDSGDPNFMSCRVILRTFDATTTTIEIKLRVRLSRENASEVHWLAPVLGEEFISRQMTKDMDDMLQEFIKNSNEELYDHAQQASVSR